MSSADRASWSLNNPDYTGWNFNESVAYRANLVWDTIGLTWVKMTQPGGGGGGGAVTIADGADITLGAVADAGVLGDVSGTVSAKLRGINNTMQKIVGLGLPIYDYVAQSQSSTQDVWTFKTGGSGGSLVATITMNYTDSTKAVILNVAKT